MRLDGGLIRRGGMLALAGLLATLAGLVADAPPGRHAGHRVAFAVAANPQPMPTARRGPGAAMGPDGKLYVIGGKALSTGPQSVESMTLVEAYDPVANTWQTRAPMPTPRHLLAAVAVNGKIYALGGNIDRVSANTLSDAVEEYDPTSNSWSARTPMPVARTGIGAAVTNDGKILVSGGLADQGQSVDRVDLYDPETDTWQSRRGMLNARNHHVLSRAGNGKFYALGGYAYPDSTLVAAVEEYDFSLNSWSTKGSIPQPFYTAGSVVGSDGNIRVIGGSTHSTMFSNVRIYDPDANQWSTHPSLSVNRSQLGAALGDDGAIYAVGGLAPDSSPTVVALLEIYDPASSAWRPDIVPPAIQSFAINAGQSVATSHGVQLNLTAADNLGELATMKFSNDGVTWSNPQSFSTETTWNVTSGDGTKTVYARVFDQSGNVSDTVSDSIVLDTTAAAGQLKVNAGAAATKNVDVALSVQASDASEMAFSNDDGANWSAWEPYAPTKAWTLSEGSDGTRIVSARVRDSVGNISPTFSDTIVYDSAPPSIASVTINGGALATASTTVSLALQATDPAGGSGVSQMSFSNDAGATWSAWEAFTSTKSWTLAGGNGPKTVQARVRDAAGNLSNAASDTIALDTSVGSSFGVSINNAAVWTNTVAVNLAIGSRTRHREDGDQQRRRLRKRIVGAVRRAQAVEPR
jgi:N-acetylneuraminic acid mutarotase